MKLKKWLKENKIFFELFSSILLSIMAIIVSYSSYLITKKQLVISQIEQSPNFFIKTSYRDENYSEIELQIYNNGAPIKQFDSHIYSFLKIRQKIYHGYQFKLIPIIGFYNTSINYQNTIGKLSSHHGYKNNKYLSELMKKILYDKQWSDLNISDIQHIYIVEINYTNRLNENRDTYFRETLLVPKNQIETYLNYQEKEINYLYLNTINKKNLKKVLNLTKPWKMNNLP